MTALRAPRLESTVTDTVFSPVITGVPWEPPADLKDWYPRGRQAFEHPLLQRIAGGLAHDREVRGWVRSRVCLAEYLARKEVLVLAQVSDRDTRRRWTPRLLAIDGHGDFYGPAKQGLAESWRCLASRLGSVPEPGEQALESTLAALFDASLEGVRHSSWAASLGAALVDDAVIRHDGVMARRLAEAAGQGGLGWALQCHGALERNTLAAVSAWLAGDDAGRAAPLLQAVERRVALEHAVLSAVQALMAPS